MAFRELPPPIRGGSKALNPHATISAHKTAAKHPSVVIGIPRAMLRDAGMSDLPGEKVNILVGEGPDAGKIAIVPGTRSTLTRVGNGKNRLQLAFTGIARRPQSTATVEVIVGRKQLVFALPVGFCDAAPIQLEQAA